MMLGASVGTKHTEMRLGGIIRITCGGLGVGTGNCEKMSDIDDTVHRTMVGGSGFDVTESLRSESMCILLQRLIDSW